MVVTDYNEQFLDKRGTDHLIEELKAYIDGISTGDIDLSDYVTKSELQAKLDALDINIDLSSYATKEELTEAINSIDLSSYALKTDIPSLDGYAKTSDIPTVPSKVSELENDKGYLTEHQDLSDYATRAEIPSLEGYATTEYVDNAVANIPSGGGTTDLSNYYTKDEVYTKEETDSLIPTVTNGKDGVDGVSPTVTVTKEGKVATITCTDVNGTTTATISDGADGSSSGGGSSSGSTEIYSTEEVAIGTWIDGKTIYRKVFEVTISSSTNGTPVISSIEHGIENFYQLVDLRCINNNSSMKTSIGAYGLTPTNLANLTSWNNIKNYSIRPTVTSSKIMIDAGSSWNKAVITVIIEYTKSS